jgi:hypothetical protein
MNPASLLTEVNQLNNIGEREFAQIALERHRLEIGYRVQGTVGRAAL